MTDPQKLGSRAHIHAMRACLVMLLEEAHGARMALPALHIRLAILELDDHLRRAGAVPPEREA